MSSLLEGRVAFVTGAAQGIGFAVAERFAEEGARVMLADINEAAAARAADRLRELGHDVHAVQVDVTSEASLESAAGVCYQRFGEEPWAVVANAGILHLAPLVEIPLGRWERVIKVNLTGVFLTCKVFARRLQRTNKGGRIIATSSIFGRRGGYGNAAYSASKFGVIGMVESLAAELAPHGILVNAVCPGQVDTDMMRQVVADKAIANNESVEIATSRMAERIPLGRLASPREVADAYVFLASPLSGYVTGQSLIIDGGWLAG